MLLGAYWLERQAMTPSNMAAGSLGFFSLTEAWLYNNSEGRLYRMSNFSNLLSTSNK